MSKKTIRTVLWAASCVLGLLALTAGGATAAGEQAPHPMYMADASHQGASALQPPPVCCVPSPEQLTGKLPVPDLGNMAYFGGHVQVTPKIYLVFWGWGQTGAFDHTTVGYPSYDPDGA